MRDAVTSLIGTYDVTGRYFDQTALDKMKSYFDTGTARIKAAARLILMLLRLSSVLDAGYLTNSLN
jgi:hypothetical protein